MHVRTIQSHVNVSWRLNSTCPYSQQLFTNRDSLPPPPPTQTAQQELLTHWPSISHTDYSQMERDDLYGGGRAGGATSDTKSPMTCNLVNVATLCDPPPHLRPPPPPPSSRPPYLRHSLLKTRGLAKATRGDWRRDKSRRCVRRLRWPRIAQRGAIVRRE